MRTFSIYLSILILMSACQNKKGIQKSFALSLAEKQASYISATNSFALSLYQNLHNTTTKENILISPLSIATAFSMAHIGAKGETQKQIARTLQIESFTNDDVNLFHANILQQFSETDDQTFIQIANSMWIRNNFEAENDFTNTIKKSYDAEIAEADFNNPQTVHQINNWVAEKTNHKITEIIKSLSPDEVLLLINAHYFKGVWANAFNKEKTTVETFETEKGESIKTPMMNRLDSMLYFQNKSFSAIQLPYGNGNFAMNIFLPKDEYKIDDLVELFASTSWEQWMQSFEKQEKVELKLPKFKIDYQLSLNKLLVEMGMENAFSNKADFSAINKNQKLQISSALHKTLIEVDEEGTEAAAVTSIGFRLTSMPLNEPKITPFYCTKPFLFSITETKTGAILFMGKLGNPLNKHYE